MLKCLIQPPGNHANEPNRTTSSVNRESNRRQRTRFSMHRDESFHHYHSCGAVSGMSRTHIIYADVTETDIEH